MRAALLLAVVVCLVGCRERSEPLAKVPAGTFTMGSPTVEVGRDADETPHAVTLTRAFLLGKTEVTRGQWRSAMGAEAAGRTSWTDQHPATVSWHDAVAYCNARSAAEGLQKAYELGPPIAWNRSADGYRLPTEAEWAKAAQGVVGDLDAVAWCGDSDGQTPRAVGGKKATKQGLHDVVGNVEEWVWDRYDGFSAGAAIDPTGPPRGDLRVARGGSYSDDVRHCRTADRSSFPPNTVNDGLGFRVARWAE